MWWQLAIPTAIGIIAILLYSPLAGNFTSTTGETSGANYSTWDAKQHQCGNSPWMHKFRGVADQDIDPPAECHVDQVHMMSRHGERYPTLKSGIRMLELYQRIQHANITFQSDLEFLNRWNFFAPHPSEQFEQLISTGPYAGTLQAFTAGVKLRTRYLPLLKAATADGSMNFWASDSERVIDTARYFAAGFFGYHWERLATLHIIPESADQGPNTLTPGRSCPNYVSNRNGRGHDFGAEMLYAFRATYLPQISRRLRKQNPGIVFEDTEIYAMQEICGFETMVTGHSDWCNVFTEDEWLSFEYARDLLHYYRAGPGNPYGAAMGWLWLNATADLLRQGSSAGELFFSFNHDGDMVAFLAALDLFHQEPDLPTSHVLHDRVWRLSDVAPMGARIILERLVCGQPQECWDNGPMYPNHVYCSPQTSETFVRLNINDAIVAIPDCQDGPGQSCPLSKFLAKIEERGRALTPYRELCNVTASTSERITFLRH